MDTLEKINKPKLDLACGDNKREGFFGIDVVKTESVDYVFDLQQFPWPIESESVEEINCSHYIEHIPHDNTKAILKESNSFEEFKDKMVASKDGAIEFFNEIYRILKPGGKVKLIAPYYSSIRAWGDPTHTRAICDLSFYYLDKKWMDDNKLSHYGLNCDFEVSLSYFINNELTLKSDEVRTNMIKHSLNTVEDIIVELIKK